MKKDLKRQLLFSNAITSSKGGLIGWVAATSISKSYLSEIDKLNNGEVSNPINNKVTLFLSN